MTDPDIMDIVTMLRAPDRLEPYLCAAAAEEIEQLRKERDEAMALVEIIAHDVSVLSTRPAAIIKLSDLVHQINEWGDAARKILDKKENTNE
jgi:hypothetical protein